MDVELIKLLATLGNTGGFGAGAVLGVILAWVLWMLRSELKGGRDKAQHFAELNQKTISENAAAMATLTATVTMLATTMLAKFSVPERRTR